MERQRYLKRLSGPLLDRINLKVYVHDLPFEDLAQTRPSESSADIRQRVNRARAVQQARFQGTGLTCNADMTTTELRQYCQLDDESLELVRGPLRRII